MTLSIKAITTTTLTVLLSYLNTNPVVAITNSRIQPFQLTKSVDYSSAIAQATTTDTLIVPGERVGAVTRNTTRRELVKLYGSQRLKDFTMPGPEGIGSFAATKVNLGAQKSFTIVWSDCAERSARCDRSRTKPSSVRDFGTAWKTPEGIGVGTTLSQLRQKLGEFKLFGLGWDYGGTVLLEKTRLSRYQGKLTLRVDAAQGAVDKFSNDYQAVSGDGEFSSTNPHWKPLGIKVEQMIVTLNS